MSLENVKADDILVLHMHFGRQRELVKVGRTTKTLVITTRGHRFRKADGFESGKKGFHATRVTVPGDGEIVKVNKEQRTRHLIGVISRKSEINKLRKLSLESLETLKIALDKVDAREKSHSSS